MIWTDEKVKALAEQWNAGASITQIGKQLGTTRNAVVGKAHRMGLPARLSPIRRAMPTPAPEAVLRGVGKP